jgi:hypothetical protein
VRENGFLEYTRRDSNPSTNTLAKQGQPDLEGTQEGTFDELKSDPALSELSNLWPRLGESDRDSLLAIARGMANRKRAD